MAPRITIPESEIEAFCQRNRISHLALFGSVLRDDFSPESDVDVLIEFEEGARVGFIALAGMEIELTELLGRRTELHTVKGLNPRFRENVLAQAESLYDAA